MKFSMDTLFFRRGLLIIRIVVVFLLVACWSTAFGSTDTGKTLNEAVLTNDVAAVSKLLEGRASAKATTDYGMTLLHYAAMKGNSDIAQMLIDHGADPNAKARDGATPLHYASTATVAETLLKSGASLKAKANNGYLPIHWACWSPLGTSEAVAFYIKKGVSPNVHTENDRSETPLHLAALTGKIDTVKTLIAEGANVNEPNSFGAGPLFEARHSKTSVQIATVLVASGAKVKARANDGDTPLHYMADDSETDVAKFLLDKGADPNAKNDEGETPLHITSKRGYAQMADVLIKNGANIEAKDQEGNTPLILASGRQFDYMDTEVAKLLISKGANINAKNSDGETPLHVVYQEEIASVLLKAGANPNAKSVGGSTPLHVIGKPSVAELLITAGADVNAQDDSGQTPLHSVAYRNNRDMAELLIKHGANVNTKDNDGLTPLKCCRYKPTADVIRRHGGK